MHRKINGSHLWKVSVTPDRDGNLWITTRPKNMHIAIRKAIRFLKNKYRGERVSVTDITYSGTLDA